MIVSELEEYLARLPGDMAVYVLGGGGCYHVRELHKAPRQRWRMSRHGLPPLAIEDDQGRTPPHLTLRDSSLGLPRVLWHDAHADAVDWTLTGNWPRKAVRQHTNTL